MAITPLSLFLPPPPRSAGLAALRAAESRRAADPAELVDTVLNDQALAAAGTPAAGAAATAVSLPAAAARSLATVTAVPASDPAEPAIATPATGSQPGAAPVPDDSATAALQNEIRRQQNQLLQLAVTPDTAADAAAAVADENLLAQRLLQLRQNDSASLTEAVRQAAAELARQQQDLLQEPGDIADLTAPLTAAAQQALSTSNTTALPSPPSPATDIPGEPVDANVDVAPAAVLPAEAAPVAAPPATALPAEVAPVAASSVAASPAQVAPAAPPPAAALPAEVAPPAPPPAAALPTETAPPVAALPAEAPALATPPAATLRAEGTPPVVAAVPAGVAPAPAPPAEVALAAASPASVPSNALRAAARVNMARPAVGALEPFMLYSPPSVPMAAVADPQIVLPPFDGRIVTATGAAADSLQSKLPWQTPYEAGRAYTARGTVVMASETPIAAIGGQVDERV